MELTPSTGHRFDAVGFCIYCGAAGKLTDEHVVPYGLGGNSLILPKSSCGECAMTTGGLENSFLRLTTGRLREMLALPTRGKTVRTGQCELQAYECLTDGQLIPANYFVRQPIKDAPIFYPVPILPPPAIFSDANGTTPAEVEFRAILLNGKISDLPPGHRIYLGGFRPSDLYRQLIKIAYGYAVGVLGPRTFKPLVQEIILGKSEAFQHFLGCFSDQPSPNGKTVNLQQGFAEWHAKRYVIVRVQIFGQLPTPTYCAVVGEAL